MGIEYRIESHDLSRVDLAALLARMDPRPTLDENCATFRLAGNHSTMPDVQVRWAADHVYMVHYGDTRLATQVLGEVVRAIAAVSDHLLLQEL